MAMYLSCFVGVILLVVYIVMCRKQRNVKGLFVKSFVSVCYLMTCAFATMSSPEGIVSAYLLWSAESWV